MPTYKLDPDILTAALHGLEAERQRIESQIAQVRGLLGSKLAPAVAAEPSPHGRRRMSPAARKRIAEAQRKRWEAFHKKAGHPETAQKPAEAPRPKRKLSAAGRRRIIEATKKRWAAFRKAQKGSAKAAKKPAGKRVAA